MTNTKLSLWVPLGSLLVVWAWRRVAFNQAKLTQEAFITLAADLKNTVRLYKTGDLVRYLPVAPLNI